ncbi:hypothetical protein B0H14DRAFT_2555079 [Mycena olivaceomarginata]|nr:hypothetical protein B0H14DRAFT_2555079 [Mycena olivaceomarginata]
MPPLGTTRNQVNGDGSTIYEDVERNDQADEVRNNEVVRPDKQHLTGNIMLLRLPSTYEIVASATKAKLVQRNIKDEDGMLIAPHKLYEKLTEGTLFIALVSFRPSCSRRIIHTRRITYTLNNSRSLIKGTATRGAPTRQPYTKASTLRMRVRTLPPVPDAAVDDAFKTFESLSKKRRV